MLATMCLAVTFDNTRPSPDELMTALCRSQMAMITLRAACKSSMSEEFSGKWGGMYGR